MRNCLSPVASNNSNCGGILQGQVKVSLLVTDASEETLEMENTLRESYVCTHRERNEVRWRREQEASLATPSSNLRSFGSKCTVLKNVLVTSLGLLGASRSDSAPGKLCPSCPSLVTPPVYTHSPKCGRLKLHCPVRAIFKTQPLFR